MYYGFGTLFLAALIHLVLLGLIVLSIYMIFKNNQAARNEKDSSTNKALDILDERYAKGEIDQTEYEKIKRDLRES